MGRQPRHLWTTLAIYLLFVFILQMAFYIAVPKDRYLSSRGTVVTGVVGSEHRYISVFYLNRTADGFAIATKSDFLRSTHPQSEDSESIYIAEIDWYERKSLFDMLSLISISDRKRDFIGFSARIGTRGEYTTVDSSMYLEMVSTIGFRLTSFALPTVHPLSLLFKLLVHSLLIWYAIKLAPSAYKEIRWFFLPTPHKTRGQCVNCKYSTKGLTTPICPECGQHHGMEWKSPA